MFLLFAFLLYISFSYPYEFLRIVFPVIILLVGIITTVIKMLDAAKQPKRTKENAIEKDSGECMVVSNRMVIYSLLWLAGTCIVIYKFGFLIGTALSSFFYVFLLKRGWIQAILLGLFSALGIYVIAKILRIAI